MNDSVYKCLFSKKEVEEKEQNTAIIHDPRSA